MERMAELVPAGAPALAARPAGPPAPAPAPLGPLERLRMTELAAVHPSGRGVHGVDLELERGTLTVICGPVGSGKTTLVRALLGLVPAAGLLRWNGEAVTDRAAWCRPLRLRAPGAASAVRLAGRQRPARRREPGPPAPGCRAGGARP